MIVSNNKDFHCHFHRRRIFLARDCDVAGVMTKHIAETTSDNLFLEEMLFLFDVCRLQECQSHHFRRRNPQPNSIGRLCIWQRGFCLNATPHRSIERPRCPRFSSVRRKSGPSTTRRFYNSGRFALCLQTISAY
jgi:hypothetical protein